MRFGWGSELDAFGGGFGEAAGDGGEAGGVEEGGFVEGDAEAFVPAGVEEAAGGLHQRRQGGVGGAFEVEDLRVGGFFGGAG